MINKIKATSILFRDLNDRITWRFASHDDYLLKEQDVKIIIKSLTPDSKISK